MRPVAWALLSLLVLELVTFDEPLFRNIKIIH